MDEATAAIINIFLVLLLVLANGFFVAAEFAIVRAHPSKLKSRDNLRKVGTRASLGLIKDIDQSLSATQLGITIASLLLGWYGEHTFQQLFVKSFVLIGEPWSLYLSHAVATACALVVITFLHVVLGELVAKSIAIIYPETTLRMLSGPMVVFVKVFNPLIKTATWCSNLFLHLLGINEVAEGERAHSSAELALLVSHSAKKGELDEEEGKMLRGVFGFSDKVAREVMTPRPDLVTINLSDNFDKVLTTIVGSGLSRFPVISEDLDNIKGILLARDIMPSLAAVKRRGFEDFHVSKLMREALFIPETKPVDQLLNEMKKQKTHMAIVLDEHSVVAGVVTLEDLIEEIVGDIYDESDAEELEIVVQDDGDVIVDGGVLVTDINEIFELNIPEGEYDTIAGFIFSSLGRIPEDGDQIFVDNGIVMLAGLDDPSSKAQIQNGSPKIGSSPDNVLEEPTDDSPWIQALITVERLDGNRIELVRLHPLQAERSAET